MEHWDTAIFTGIFILICYMVAEVLFWWISFY
jgi:hypothetical protein